MGGCIWRTQCAGAVSSSAWHQTCRAIERRVGERASRAAVVCKRVRSGRSVLLARPKGFSVERWGCGVEDAPDSALPGSWVGGKAVGIRCTRTVPERGESLTAATVRQLTRTSGGRRTQDTTAAAYLLMNSKVLVRRPLGAPSKSHRRLARPEAAVGFCRHTAHRRRFTLSTRQQPQSCWPCVSL